MNRSPVRLGAVVGAVLSLGACASPGQFAGTVPMDRMPIGSCHRMTDPIELYGPSDDAPPVPCDSPHQSETLAFAPLPAAMAGLAERPERPADVAGPVCDGPEYRLLRGYLGADDLDRQFGIGVWMKFPTRAEWAGGLRRVRCDMSVASAFPVLDGPLRGALRRTDSAYLRHCRDGMTDVTCDRLHTAEQVGGWIGVRGTRYPGQQAVDKTVDDQCWRNAERYTAGRLDSLPVRTASASITPAQWRRGVRTSDCWIISRSGTKGTLRAGLTKESSQ